MGINVIGPAPAGGAIRKTERITSTTSWTAPSDCYSVDVVLIGGGGGGGGWGNSNDASGGGAGGAQYLTATLEVTPGTTYPITIGGGGSGGSSNAASAGSPSTFGNLAKAYPGGFGRSGNIQQIGAGQATNVNFRWPEIANYGGESDNGQVSRANGGNGGSRSSQGLPGSQIAPFTQFAGSQYSIGAGHGWTTGQLVDKRDGGSGIDGAYCGGGGGALGSYQTNNFFSGSRGYGNSGGGHGSFTNSNQQINATPGDVNTGGGGGGGSRQASPVRQAVGGNGGSGLCILTYWTAE